MLLVLARDVTLGLSVLACSLSAGFFYAYSVSVIGGLAAVEPLAAVRAMQGINANIRTPVFAFAFFGALAFPALAAACAFAAGNRRAAALALAGALVYAVGVFAVTFGVNVPLNDSLAAVGPSPTNAATVWRDYAAPWLAWNHVRTGAAVLALGLVVAAVVERARMGSL